jgi:uncharacterized protein YcfJ
MRLQAGEKDMAVAVAAAAGRLGGGWLGGNSKRDWQGRRVY